MRVSVRSAVLALGGLFLAASAFAQAPQRKPGVLLLAHGGKPEWNERVAALAKSLDAEQPVEVAFGMATRANIQAAANRLVERGATEIIAVPLFVSSHSSVITSTEYLLGLRKDMPEDLLKFARMSHGHGGHGAGGHGSAHGAAASADGTTPISVPVPVRMTPALNRHPLVADILSTRARAISTDPAREAVILVAHGPVRDEENERWLADMRVLAEWVAASAPFASVDALTVRDDAPKPVRDAASAELRALVEKRAGEGRRVLIVPLLMSFGGIEQGIRARLEGLDYTMAPQGLMPDDRIATWVREMVAGATQLTASR
ncbi:MAG TPA: CbiX/SirB N-terminal domain-containing protein [Vicinamibacterales bacterium]